LIYPLILLLDVISIVALANLVANVVSIVVGYGVSTRDYCGFDGGWPQRVVGWRPLTPSAFFKIQGDEMVSKDVELH
jgi:hypothetical protein